MRRKACYLVAVLLIVFFAKVNTAEIPGRIRTRLRAGTDSAYGFDCALDSAHSLYLAGRASGPIDGQTNAPSGQDAMLIKWDANGDWEWTRLWGSSNRAETVHDIATEGTSFVYVVGGTDGAFDGETNAGMEDAWITKWRWDGTRVWTRLWGTASNDAAYGVAINAYTDILVCGYSAGALDGQTNTGGADFMLTKLDADGNRAWTKLWGSTEDDLAGGVTACDDIGRTAYVGGTAGGDVFDQAALGGGDFCLTRWATAKGHHDWTRLWGSVAPDMALAGCLAAQASNLIAVVGITLGSFDGETNPADYSACVSLWTNGPDRVWTRIFGPTNNSLASGVAIDGNGTVFVSGITRGPFHGWTNSTTGKDDLFLCAYNTHGSNLWTRLWGNVSNDQWEGRCAVRDDRVAVAFDTYQTGFDGEDVGAAYTHKAGVSLYTPCFRPSAASIEQQDEGMIVTWRGAWDCGLAFDAGTGLHAWTNLSGLSDVAGAERMTFTNMIDADHRFYRARAWPRPYRHPVGPESMVYIPSGTFVMGAAAIAEPVHKNDISGFWMDAKETTKSEWDTVRSWALTNGYSILNVGGGKSASHPVQTINWYDVVKWANARSEREGRSPCYYTDAALTNVYRTGDLDLSNDWVNWSADGYRLPTEAEWEKAARGAHEGYLFPWGSDTIAHTQANYVSSASYPYDTSDTRGYHPAYTNGGTPYTSPVGSFEPNAFGLYDMAGNVAEWTWDWYDLGYYAVSPARDPRGPESGTYRCRRGGAWYIEAPYSRAANRNQFIGGPGNGDNTLGFRLVRGGF